MKSFLLSVASHVLKENPEGLEKTTFILPNRRAVRVFKGHLAEHAGRPIWTPEMHSIDDWLTGVSGLAEADGINQLITLYEAVKVNSRQNESFDVFIRWGEILLGDFNDIDKYLVEPESIFRTISSIKEIEIKFPSLSPEQANQLQRFWKGFEPVATEFQEKWLELWKSLGKTYQHFHESMENQGVGTGGSIYRRAYRKISEDPPAYFPNDKYLFIGFNALTSVEEKIFELCLRLGKAGFFWDIPENLLDSHQESGRFIRENVNKFPQYESFKPEIELLHGRFGGTLPSGFAPVDIYACESVSGQVGLLRQLLEEDTCGKDPAAWRKAVILSDESLLEPVLAAVSSPGRDVNISMGYPLSGSLLADFTARIIDLNIYVQADRGSLSFLPAARLKQLLGHPVMKALTAEVEIGGTDLINKWPSGKIPLGYVLKFSPGLECLFCYHDSLVMIDKLLAILSKLESFNINQAALERESFKRLRDWLVLLRQELINKQLILSFDSFRQLISGFVNKERVPFEGRLDSAIQLTGILETRLMDYDEIIVLSCNEGVWPAGSIPPSLIPYNLRRANKLPTREFRDSFYGYYFYRLLNRAAKISLMYLSAPEPAGMSQGEPSRFILQLLYDSGQPCNRHVVASPLNPGVPPARQVMKSGPVLEKLNLYLDVDGKKFISPSALNAYIDCPLRFAYQNILGIREDEEPAEAGEPRAFGTLLHKSLQNFYSGFEKSGKTVTAGYLSNALQKGDEILTACKNAFLTEYFGMKEDDEWPGLFGKDLLVREVLLKHMRSVILFDRSYAPFRIIGLEKYVAGKVDFILGDKSLSIKLGGFIDRIDEKEGVARVIDYKTGSPDLSFNDIPELADSSRNKRGREVLQSLIYSSLLRNELPGDITIRPAIYPTGRMTNSRFDPGISDKRNKAAVSNIIDYEADVMELLRSLMAEIFDFSLAFCQTENESNCKFCDFRDYCHR